MIKLNPVFIYPPTIDWDYLHQRPQQLLKALSRLGCISIFCNLNLHKRYKTGLTYLNENLILANGISFRAAVNWAKTTYTLSPLIAYFTYPPYASQIQSLAFDLILFDSVDEPINEFASWFPSYETAVQTADIVIASAHSLVNRASSLTNSAVYFIPNGCDYEHFKTSQTKLSIDCEPFTQSKPIIGYIGSIAPWLDLALVNSMARCLPDYEFVFIGPLLLLKGIAFTSKNMHYLGHKDYAHLPRYMSNFSFCLIPFKLTEMTRGVNPVKFWEYLASGIPILSTPLPEIPQEYVTIITEALLPSFSPNQNQTGREARIKLARENSWESRSTQLLQIIHAKLNK